MRESDAEILRRFEYQQPSIVGVRKIKDLRLAYQRLAAMILEEIPGSRERSLALTALQDASMWTNCAIVFMEGPKDAGSEIV